MEEIELQMRTALDYLQEDNFSLAEEVYAMCLESAQTELGEGHPVTASLLGHLARTYLAQNNGKSDFAVSLLERQLYIYENERNLQSLLAERSTCLIELESGLREIGRLEDADEVKIKSDLMTAECARRMEELEAKLNHINGSDGEEEVGYEGD